MRSFLKPLSRRAKYCVPFRIDVAPNEPVSIMGVAQGMLFTTAVPQMGLPDASLPNTCCAVWDTVTPDTPDGRYLARTPVPTVFAKAGVLWAKLMNSGAANVTDPPALDDDRNGSTEKKKKKLWWGMTGPPTAKSILLEWNGL